MFRQVVLAVLIVFLAFAILGASIFRSASPLSYAFTLPSDEDVNGGEVKGETEEAKEIEYSFVYPGKILPDSPLWSLKALRDKIWIFITRDLTKRSELKLLCSDKRIVASRMLFEKDKPELGFSTLTKAEKYLEGAVEDERASRRSGGDTSNLLLRLSAASLKHLEVIDQILELAPSDAKPEIIKTKEYAKKAFEKTRQGLNEKGMEVPENPFEGENW